MKRKKHESIIILSGFIIIFFIILFLPRYYSIFGINMISFGMINSPIGFHIPNYVELVVFILPAIFSIGLMIWIIKNYQNLFMSPDQKIIPSIPSSDTFPNISQKMDSDPLQPVLPHINRLIQSQPHPLESLDKFYAFLELEGFTLTPDLKNAIRNKIEIILDEKEKAWKKQQISSELFGGSPTIPQTPSSIEQVIPLPTVLHGSTCQICLSEFSSAEPGAVKCPHCGNVFHYRCIAKWVNKNGTCPICKKELKS
jgi:hypothetical protein